MRDKNFYQRFKQFILLLSAFVVCVILLEHRGTVKLKQIQQKITQKTFKNLTIKDNGDICYVFEQTHFYNNKENLAYISTTQQQIAYNRLPKAGSGPARIHMASLAQQNGFNVIHYGRHDSSHVITESVLQEECEKTKQTPAPWLYIGHIHYVNFTAHGCAAEPLYINLIRDPISCFVSTYYFLRFKHARQMSPERRNMTFDECVLSEDEECTGKRHITRIIPYFCGQEDFCLEGGPQALNQAKENIRRHYSVIGYLENIDAFYEVLEHMLPHFFTGLFDVYKGKGSHTKAKSEGTKKIEPSKLAMDEFRKRLSLEYELYYFIKHRFDCLANSLGVKLVH